MIALVDIGGCLRILRCKRSSMCNRWSGCCETAGDLSITLYRWPSATWLPVVAAEEELGREGTEGAMRRVEPWADLAAGCNRIYS